MWKHTNIYRLIYIIPGGDPLPDLLPAVAGETDGKPQRLQLGRAAISHRGLLQAEKAAALSHLQLKCEKKKDLAFPSIFLYLVGFGA